MRLSTSSADGVIERPTFSLKTRFSWCPVSKAKLLESSIGGAVSTRMLSGADATEVFPPTVAVAVMAYSPSVRSLAVTDHRPPASAMPLPTGKPAA